MAGPLTGVRVLELAGIGPGPFGGMLLSDMGADVLRVDRPERLTAAEAAMARRDVVRRGRRSVAVDLKTAGGVEVFLRLVAEADAVIEPLRPGVAERLGIGPEPCMARNPRLVYARMTGWGQDGPLARAAGHDIDFIALAGALEAIGRRGDAPVPPLNLVGDNGGGGMLLAFGIVCGVLEARTSGQGQVLDAAIVDGAALLTANFHGFRAMGRWNDERGTNLCTGAPYYDAYETADGKYVAVGAQEPKFYDELMRRLGLDPDALPPQDDTAAWPTTKKLVADAIGRRTRAEWCELLEGTDACFAPVLSFDEAPVHPHNTARGTFVEENGVVQPAPAPRFSRTPGRIVQPPVPAGEHTIEALVEWGFTEEEVDDLLVRSVVATAASSEPPH